MLASEAEVDYIFQFGISDSFVMAKELVCDCIIHFCMPCYL